MSALSLCNDGKKSPQELRTHVSLFIALRDIVMNSGWTVNHAASRLNTSQSSIRSIIHGDFDAFSSEKLLTYLFKAGWLGRTPVYIE